MSGLIDFMGRSFNPFFSGLSGFGSGAFSGYSSDYAGQDKFVVSDSGDFLINERYFYKLRTEKERNEYLKELTKLNATKKS